MPIHPTFTPIVPTDGASLAAAVFLAAWAMAAILFAAWLADRLRP